ncbi:CZB domain-containing protein [Ferrimonas pelagia]
MDHLAWKSSVYKAAVSGEGDVNAFADHTMCRLGKWYYQGEGAENHATKQGFRALEAPHKAVHTNGIAALRAVREDDIASGTLFVAMEDASDQVVDCLDRLAASLD